jgi:transcription elongation factor Elf1
LEDIKSTKNDEFAECPSCFAVQNNIDGDSEDGLYECERCGAEFDLTVEVEEVIEYINTFMTVLVTEEDIEEKLRKEQSKPCPGQIDIWGKTVGEEDGHM